eukprot:gene11166-14984_t
MFHWGSTKDHKVVKETEKEKQIQILKKSYPSIRRPNNNDDSFEILLNIQSVYSSLKIFIPSDFPNDKPVLQVVGPLLHPWLDKHKQVVHAPKLLNWNKSSTLLDLINDMVATLQSGTNLPNNSDPNQTPVAPAYSHNNSNSSQSNAVSNYSALPVPSNNSSNYPVSAVNSYNNAYPVNSTPSSNSNVYPINSIPSSNSNNFNNSNNNFNGLHPTNSNNNNNNNANGANSIIYPMNNGNNYNNHPNGMNSNSLNGFQPYPPVQSKQSPSDLLSIYQQQAIYNPATRLPSLPQNQINSSIPNNSMQIQQPSLERNISLSDNAMELNFAKTPITMPEIPQKFPELDQLSDYQLERLLNDEVAFKVFVCNTDTIMIPRSLRDTLVESNENSAVRNVQLGEEIVGVGKTVTSLQDELKELTPKYYKSLVNANKLYVKSDEVIIQQLSKKKNELDEESENIGKTFVEGKVGMDSFLKDYLSARTKYYSIASKLTSSIRK